MDKPSLVTVKDTMVRRYIRYGLNQNNGKEQTDIFLVDKNGSESNYILKASHSYFRKAGVEHNVINNGKKKLIFIETELKNRKKD